MRHWPFGERASTGASDDPFATTGAFGATGDQGLGDMVTALRGDLMTAPSPARVSSDVGLMVEAHSQSLSAGWWAGMTASALGQSRRARTWVRQRVFVSTSIGAALLMVGFSSAAAAGALPGPIQREAARLAHGLGISIPSGIPTPAVTSATGASTPHSAHSTHSTPTLPRLPVGVPTLSTTTSTSMPPVSTTTGPKSHGPSPVVGQPSVTTTTVILSFPAPTTVPSVKPTVPSRSTTTTTRPRPPTTTSSTTTTNPIVGCNGYEKIVSLTAVTINSQSSIRITATMNQDVGVSAMSAAIATWTSHGKSYGGTFNLPQVSTVEYQGVYDAGSTVPLNESVTVGICGGTPGGPIQATTMATVSTTGT